MKDLNSEQKTMCGTPNYISPEVVSRLPYGLSSDTWSIGCMMVTMLTGSPPFQCEEVKSTLERVTRGEYFLPENISSAARSLITSLIQKDPKRRPPMAALLSHEFFKGQISRLSQSQISGVKPGILTPIPNGNILPARQDISYLTNSYPQNKSENRSNTSNHSNKIGISKSAHMSSTETRDTKCISSRIASSSTLVNRQNSTNAINNQLLNNTSSNIQSIISAKDNKRIPNFTTDRLKPIKQDTKHGSISILKSGDVLIDFKNELNIIRISRNGESISTYDRSNTFEPLCIYTLNSNNIPENISRHYRYAQRFVNLVQTKTPKIVFYSPQAKCTLMENSPDPDFHLLFYNGIKSLISQNTVEITVPESITPQYCDGNFRQPNFTYRINTNTANSADIKPVFLPIFKHAQECLQQCLEVEKSSRFDKCTKYPLILKTCQSKPSGETKEILHSGNRFDGGSSTAGSKISVAPLQLNHQSSVRSLRSTNFSSSGGHSTIETITHYLDGIGWCMSTSDKQFIMLFNDGCRVNIHSLTQIVTFISPKVSTLPERY